MESRDPQSRPYMLSALLRGHTDDVRSLATDSSSTLFSTSRDSTAKSWSKKEGSSEWKQERTFLGHQGFVNSSTWFQIPRQAAGTSKGFLVTGGQDAAIYAYDLDSCSAEPVHVLHGHSANVCSLHTAGSMIVSGSWDYTARIWDTTGEAEWVCTRVLVGHGAAVWDVLALSLKDYEDAALTACADGLIRLFNGSNEASVIFKGHTEPVRALAKLLPEDSECNLFASCSNDCRIIIWNVLGDMVTTLAGHDSFIYALVSIPSSQGGGLASSGEEGIVKIWDEEEGEEAQELIVPALSVWDLTTLGNGDLAIACSDNLIWVFTRDPARKANSATIQEYENRIAARKLAKTGAQPSLPLSSADVLRKPGSKNGEVKLVEADGVTHAHQWSDGRWVNMGEVTAGEGATNDAAAGAPVTTHGKTLFEGKEYDVVVGIDVSDDGAPIQLPFNFEDDAQEVAAVFVLKHGLPVSYSDRISEYLENL